MRKYFYNLFLFVILCFPILLDGFLSGAGSKYTILMLVSWALPITLFPRLAKTYFVLVPILLYPFYFFSIAHIILFGAPIGLPSFETLVETNLSESWEFITHFINLKILFLLALMLFVPIFVIQKVKRLDKNISKKMANFVAIICLVCLIITITRGIYTPNKQHTLLPLRLLTFYYSTKNDLNKLKLLKAQRKFEKFESINSIHPVDLKETYVVVLGESVDRKHLSLYGYDRDTSPLLGSLKADLYIFDNIVSPHAHTVQVLRKALTFARGNDLAPFRNKGSVINYFNDAGFKTFWISNQFTAGDSDNLPAVIGSDATSSIFLNQTHWKGGSIQKPPFDEVVLEPLAQALTDEAPKKMIFIHLMGSHTAYEHRFPENFKKFNQGKTSRQKAVDNYDNSILYTDFVLYLALNQLTQRRNEQTFFLYLADHGNDVYDNDESCLCHNEGIGSRHMFEVPFIFWPNELYAQNNPNILAHLSKSLHRLYNTQDLIYTLIWLAGLRNKDFDESKILGAEN